MVKDCDLESVQLVLFARLTQTQIYDLSMLLIMQWTQIWMEEGCGAISVVTIGVP